MKIIKFDKNQHISNFLVLEDGCFGCLLEHDKKCRLLNLSSGEEYPWCSVSNIRPETTPVFSLKLNGSGLFVYAYYFNFENNKPVKKYFNPCTGICNGDISDDSDASICDEIYDCRPVATSKNVIFYGNWMSMHYPSSFVSVKSFQKVLQIKETISKESKTAITLKQDGSDLRIMELPFMPNICLISGDELTALFASLQYNTNTQVAIIDLD